MKEKQILVTGSSGYIGSSLLKKLKDQGINFFGLDKQPDAQEGQVCLNLCDHDALGSVLREFRPDCLVHTGTHSALAHKGRPVESFREDAAGLTNILEFLKERPGCRLVFFSSSYVYSGLPQNRPVDEETVLKPIHHFGLAKSFFEQFILRNHPNAVIFRLSSVYGPGHALFPNAVFQMAEECKREKRLAIWGTGQRMMQYIFMEDVLQAILNASRLPAGLYNLGGDDYLPVAEAAKRIAQFFGVEVVYLREKTEGETLPYMKSDKLKGQLGASFFTPFATALEKYLRTVD